MRIASLTFLMLLVSLMVGLVIYKYTIDTRLTIKELKKDRDTYRNNIWNFMKGMDKERKRMEQINEQTNNLAYTNLKKKIKKLHDDIEDTDFTTFENVKEEILSSLKDIDSYGD
jgi:predicted nuclease with TOPRIM domain